MIIIIITNNIHINNMIIITIELVTLKIIFNALDTIEVLS